MFSCSKIEQEQLNTWVSFQSAEQPLLGQFSVSGNTHDRQLMNQVENELCNRQWRECVDRETFGHAYRPLSQAGQHRQTYVSA